MTKETLYAAIGDVREAYILEARRGRGGRRAAWRRWAAAACLCLAAAGALLAAVLLGGGTQDSGRGLTINRVERVERLDLDVRISQHDPSSPAEREAVWAEVARASGLRWEEFAARLPEGYSNTGFYVLEAPVVPKGTAYAPHDYVLEYRTEAGGAVQLTICPNGEPLRDTVLVCDEPQASEINGVAAVVYGVQHSFTVEFSLGEARCVLETRNIAAEGLAALLDSLTRE